MWLTAPLFPVNRDDDMAYPKGLYEAQSWSEGDMSIARSIKDPAAADLLSHMLQPDPSKRWRTEKILDHMFFNPEKRIDEGVVGVELKVMNGSQQAAHALQDRQGSTGPGRGQLENNVDRYARSTDRRETMCAYYALMPGTDHTSRDS